MSSLSVSSVNQLSVASALPQISNRLNKVAGESFPQLAGQSKDALQTKQKTTTDLLANLQTIEAQLAARAKEAANVNSLEISYNKKDALLSVKVQQEQTGNLIRELQFKDYKAMAYSSHGYKGTAVDITA